jgi:hypothetical protein
MERNTGSNDNSSLDALEQKLYQRETPLTVNKAARSDLHGRSMDISREWREQEEIPKVSMSKKRNTHTWSLWFVFGALIFFVISLAVAFFIFTGGGNIISTNNVAIELTGPASVAGGDILTLQVDIKNNNTTTLETTDLLIEYPEGTRNAEDITKELPRVRESLGNIEKGEQVSRTLDAVLFGEEGTIKKIVVSVEYRVEGSNAIFVKERSYEVEISSAPLSLSVSVPPKTTTGRELEFLVEVTSNATEQLKGVLVTAEYPFGFSFLSSTPEPLGTNQVWNIGTLKPGEKSIIRIRGILSGQDSEERVFHFVSGLVGSNDPTVIVTPFAEKISGVTIARPDIAVGLAFDGNTGAEYVGTSADFIRADISWKNNTNERIVDAVVQVVLRGTALNKSSVSSNTGFYQSGTDTIVWDKRTIPGLAEIPAGGQGQASFTFASVDFTKSLLTDPTIHADAHIQGTVGGTAGAEVVQSKTDATVVIKTDTLLSGRGLHFSGPFTNTGSLPPKVGVETFYTIQWTVTNTVSEVTSAQVRATLPSHMRFVGTILPSTETVTYNPVGGEVVWNVGTIKKGAGYNASPREVSFQVAFTPSVSQVGTEPLLIRGGTLLGFDTYTKINIQDTYREISTRITSDPLYTSEQAKVVQ